MEITHDYRNNASLRESFCTLADDTFGLDFETWYQKGFWQDNYDPHSLLIEGEVVSNVSVSRMDVLLHGEPHRLYQLGTVMTAEDCQNRGFIRDIMALVEAHTADGEGVFLFGNRDTLEFYPKFGFHPVNEYVRKKRVDQTGPCRVENVAMKDQADWDRLYAAAKNSRFPVALRVKENLAVEFFYITQFLQDFIWYWPEQDCWAVAEIFEGTLKLYEVWGREDLSLKDLIAAFGAQVDEVVLAFTPEDDHGFICRRLRDDDTTLFVKGEFFEGFNARRLQFPELARA